MKFTDLTQLKLRPGVLVAIVGLSIASAALAQSEKRESPDQAGEPKVRGEFGKPLSGEREQPAGSSVMTISRSNDGQTCTVTIKDGQPDVSAPKQMLADHPLEKKSAILAYDPARERFLIATEEEPQEEPRLIIVSDWRTEAPRAKASP